MEYFKDCMTLDALKARYKEWVLKLHPDRNPDNPNAEAEFKEMQQQYEEREAELKGDYSKARKARERRERAEREAKERRERERKEQERRKVEMAIEQARKNRQKNHSELKAGDYIYAKCLKKSVIDLATPKANDILRQAIKNGVNDECVVFIETIFDMSDSLFMESCFDNCLSGDIYGGYEVLQTADPKSGIRKGRRVAKVVMFRSEHYCAFGNPMGDQAISDFYLRTDYETMFSDLLHRIKAELEYAKREQERIQAERKAKLLAEQQPLIEEWKGKLIELSRGLSCKERETVAMDNLKTMLKQMFVGTTFKVKENKWCGGYRMEWEDGPTNDEVLKVADMFRTGNHDDNWVSPWHELFGKVEITETNRKVSVLTKARILQQLGQVTEAFRKGALLDEVIMSDFDWMMLHLMGGVDVSKASAVDLCPHNTNSDGQRTVTPLWAVQFVFKHNSYYKPRRKTAKAKN